MGWWKKKVREQPLRGRAMKNLLGWFTVLYSSTHCLPRSGLDSQLELFTWRGTTAQYIEGIWYALHLIPFRGQHINLKRTLTPSHGELHQRLWTERDGRLEIRIRGRFAPVVHIDRPRGPLAAYDFLGMNKRATSVWDGHALNYQHVRRRQGNLCGIWVRWTMDIGSSLWQMLDIFTSWRIRADLNSRAIWTSHECFMDYQDEGLGLCSIVFSDR